MADFDIIIVGSGAGGSVMAYELSRRGLRVLVLEKGVRQDPTTFAHNEFEMVPRLFKNGGLQTTSDNGITIIQGLTVGGSTVINNAIWMRPDLDRILPSWSAAGATVDRNALEAAYADVEHLLGVSPIAMDEENAGSQIFLDACSRAGIPARRLDNNRDHCIGCGWCNFGCRYNRKKSMLVTFLPWAEARGAVILDRCSDVRLKLDSSKVGAVSLTRDGRTETVTAKRFVVSAGAIGSSEVLLKSGITQGGLVGSGFHVLGGLVINGEMPFLVNGFDGIGLTCVADVGPKQVVETFFAPPGGFSITLV